jgi:hypothetical protein
LNSILPILRYVVVIKSHKTYQENVCFGPRFLLERENSGALASQDWSASGFQPTEGLIFGSLCAPGSSAVALPPDTAEVCKGGRMSQSEGAAISERSLEVESIWVVTRVHESNARNISV